jgi:nucleoside-triphosphatase
MKKVYLLTGAPGSGKTTAIQKIISNLDYEAGGFYTQEIREGGRRKGFKIVTLDGQQGTLAHVDFNEGPRIGRYGVDLAAIDRIIVTSLEQALQEKSLVIIDEIGPMEILSESFKRIVLKVLDSDALVVGSIVSRRMTFTDGIKARPDVSVVKINKHNRNGVVHHVVAQIRANY